MSPTKKSFTLSCLVAVLACVSAAATGPNDANTPLTFEVSSTVLPAPGFYDVSGAKLRRWQGTAAYAAGIVRNDSQFLLNWGEPAVNQFIQFAQSHGISDEQRRFLETTEGGMGRRSGLGHLNVYVPPNDPNSVQLLLFAMSADDARKMAEAYLQFCRDRWLRERITPVKAEIKKLSERLAASQQELPEAGPAAEAAKKAFEDLEKQVPYREDKQALEAAAELDKMLNSAQVEIAGVQAMLTAIQNHVTSLPANSSNEALKAKLEVMFVEESIALRAAEARKRMATTLRKQADSYIDFRLAWQRAEYEKDRLTRDVTEVPNLIHNAQQRLATQMKVQPQIINNKAFIYPLKQETVSTQKQEPASTQP